MLRNKAEVAEEAEFCFLVTHKGKCVCWLNLVEGNEQEIVKTFVMCIKGADQCFWCALAGN